MASSNRGNIGAFVPTSNVWDTSELAKVEVTSPEFKELLVRLYQNLNRMSLSTNIKDSAFYPTSEFTTGGQFFPDPTLTSMSQTTPTQRPIYRKVINCGALLNSATLMIPHLIPVTDGYSFVKIYGCTTDPVGFMYLPLPYSTDTASESISLSLDATNVLIRTFNDRTAFTKTYVVAEYIKT